MLEKDANLLFLDREGFRLLLKLPFLTVSDLFKQLVNIFQLSFMIHN